MTFEEIVRMEARQAKEEGREEGRAEGHAEGREETLKYLINLSSEEREAILSLTPDEIAKKISEIK